MNAVIDPALKQGSVLFTLGELETEISDRFCLELAWHKQARGEMHGEEYDRRTLATIWRKRPS